ncbi:MAG TPA: DUF1328 family protein [Tepidisphaeraceae bacterium]|jgi:uncharacterized membrane protein YtjA (UPF0391 family)|nr:DUF1328 family protein [Tepidisphaeraceae bacterium]
MSPILWIGIVFFIIALLAWAVGARGLAGMSANMGFTLLWVFLILAIILIVVGAFTGHGAAY